VGTRPAPLTYRVRTMPRALGFACATALAVVASLVGPGQALATAEAQAGGPVGGPLLASPGVVVSPGATPLPKVEAASWLVANATTGTVLAAKDAHGRFYPASTLKMLTALTVLPVLSKTQVYVARPQDVRVEGTKVGIVAGATYTVDDLFHGLFLASGNDAASALANVYGGWAPTVAGMNATASELQADDTHAVDPSGLDAPGQLTSAYDLALIARAGLQRQDFRSYTSTRRYQFPGKMPAHPGAPRPTFQIQNQNRLLMHGYVGMVGVKTGYTTLAGRTYVGAAERHGQLVIVALMRIGEPSETAAGALLDWGFTNVDRTGVGTLVGPVTDDAPATSPVAADAGGQPHARTSSGGTPTAVGVGAAAAGVGVVLAVVLVGRRRRRRAVAVRTVAARRTARL
jgi:serine-type D-Ala-D-Ala carboxypeptidase (penicillin-binding protein 5/6)